jgi:hypothetical protein
MGLWTAVESSVAFGCELTLRPGASSVAVESVECIMQERVCLKLCIAVTQKKYDFGSERKLLVTISEETNLSKCLGIYSMSLWLDQSKVVYR